MTHFFWEIAFEDHFLLCNPCQVKADSQTGWWTVLGTL